MDLENTSVLQSNTNHKQPITPVSICPLRSNCISHGSLSLNVSKGTERIIDGIDAFMLFYESRRLKACCAGRAVDDWNFPRG